MNRILAFDFGRARIGVAISDELQLLAHPLETISANKQASARLAEIVREKNVDRVVAGMPRQMMARSVLLPLRFLLLLKSSARFSPALLSLGTNDSPQSQPIEHCVTPVRK